MPRPSSSTSFLSCLRALRIALRLLVAALVTRVTAADTVGSDTPRTFNVPAGEAIETLKRTAQQGGVEIIFLAETVRGVSTPALRGEFTPREALDRLVSNTGLVIVRDARTGTLTVNRAPPPRPTPAPTPKPKTQEDPPKTMKRKTPRGLLGSLAALAFAPFESSQAAETPKGADEPAVVLSPFEVNVSGDQGWIANGTLLANRTNQPLKDVPVTIDAMTKEFMQDVGAFNDFEAAKWVANVQVADETGRSDFGRYTFRGIANQWGTNRNFFRWYIPNDGFNLERIDFGRGSNSLIFGDNEPGGQATVYTKRAIIGRTFTRALLQGGSYDSYRAELDHNLSLTKQVALRFNATNNRDGRFFDWNKFAYRGYHGTVTYRPTETTLIRAEAEFGGHERVWGDNNHSIQERPAAGQGFINRFTVLPNGAMIDNTLTPDGTAIPGGTAWSNARDRGDASGNAMVLLDRDTRRVGNFSFNGFSKSTNWGGPDDIENRHYTTFTVYLEQRFTPNLVAEFAFNQQKQWRDATNIGNTYLSKVDFTGRRYFDATWNGAREQNTVQTPRAMLGYNFDRLSWMKQYFVATTEYRLDQYMAVQRSLRWMTAPGVTPTTNVAGTGFQPVFRYYQDEAGAYAATASRIFAQMPAGTRPFETAVGGQQHVSKAYAISASGTYLGGRFQTLLGARYDENDTADFADWSAVNRTAQGEFQWPGSKDEHGDRWRYNATFRHRKPTHNLGLVYVINKSTNLYVMNSSSFRFQGSFNFINQGTNAILGETTEAGLKSAFLDNKLQWNLTWYDLKRENVLADFNRNGVTDAQLQAAINTGIDPSSPNYLVVRTGSSRDSRTQLSRGWETSFLFFPAKGLNVRLSGAYIKVTQMNSFPIITRLLDAADARNPTDPAIRSTLSLLRQGVLSSGTNGTNVVGAGAVPFSFNYVFDYRFSADSKLNGVSLGVNGGYNGDYALGYFGNYPSAKISGGAAFTLNGSAGYRRKILGRAVTFRLNLYNVVAPKYREVGIVTLNNNTTYMKRIYYGTPLTFRLTVSTEF
jgi:hypothetical protein